MLLADDHQAIIEQVKQLLSADFEVIGAVPDGELLLEASEKLDPDVVVVDISMPVMGGLEAVAELKRRRSRARIVFLTVFTAKDYVEACFSAGADAYVVKTRVASDLIRAINEVLAGNKFVFDGRV